jgi:hypothetical protein
MTPFICPLMQNFFANQRFGYFMAATLALVLFSASIEA